MFSEMSVFAICRGRDNFCENLRSENLSWANDGADPGVSHGGNIILNKNICISAGMDKNLFQKLSKAVSKLSTFDI